MCETIYTENIFITKFGTFVKVKCDDKKENIIAGWQKYSSEKLELDICNFFRKYGQKNKSKNERNRTHEKTFSWYNV